MVSSPSCSRPKSASASAEELELVVEELALELELLEQPARQRSAARRPQAMITASFLNFIESPFDLWHAISEILRTTLLKDLRIKYPINGLMMGYKAEIAPCLGFE